MQLFNIDEAYKMRKATNTKAKNTCKMTVTLCDKEPFPHEEVYLFDNSLKETNI